MSSNYSGTDTHGLMTVHLACPTGDRGSAKTIAGSTRRNSHPRCSSSLWNSRVVPRSCAWAANFRYRGTQLWMTDDQAGRGRYADTSHRTQQDSRVGSWTPKFGTAHSSWCQPHTCLFLHTWWYSRDCIWTLKKVSNTPHTPNSQVNSAITLGCANYLVASVIC